MIELFTLPYSRGRFTRCSYSSHDFFWMPVVIVSFLTHTVSVRPFCWGGGTIFSPKFWKGGGIKKNSTWGDLKSSRNGYFPGGLTMFLVKKNPLKIKYGFEGSIPNDDLSLFYPNNQLMFTFVTFWFC